MKNINIIVCTHKRWDIPDNDIYTPLHVGKALANKDLGFQGDDTGDNISIKNSNYCELTGLYWGWKNLSSEYKGLCHYRRYLDFKGENPIDFMAGYDIVLPKLVVLPSRASDQLMSLTTREDFLIMIMAIVKLYPDYRKSILKYLYNSNRCSCFNMMFCRKEIYDDYCSWLFPIFTEMEKWVKLSSYSRLSRLYGFLSEYLPYIYCKHNNLKIKYTDVISDITQSQKKQHSYKDSVKGTVKRLIRDTVFLLYPRQKNFLVNAHDALIVGFKNDGIPYIDSEGIVHIK